MQCSECGSTSVMEDRLKGDAICEGCGVVVGPRLIDYDHEEKRTFNQDRSAAGGKEDNSRTSRMEGISGNVTRVKGDRNPNSKNAEYINSLQATNNSTVSYKDQKITDGRKDIGKYCEDLSLVKNVSQRAEEIWGLFEKSRKKYSRSGDKHMYLAIIYKACKDMNCGRTFKEIAQKTRGDSKQITRAYKRLTKNLLDQEESGQLKPLKKYNDINKQGCSAAETIPRFVEGLDLPPAMQKGSQKVAQVAASFLEGKQPSTVAAASILFQIRHITPLESVRDKDVAAGAGIASSTLRSAYRVLEENAAAIREQLK